MSVAANGSPARNRDAEGVGGWRRGGARTAAGRPEPHGLSLPQRQTPDGGADRGNPRLEIDHAEEGLERRGEDGVARAAAGLLLTSPEAEERTEVELGRPAREALARDELGAPRRQDADRGRGVLGEQVLGDDESERGVAEERQ